MSTRKALSDNLSGLLNDESDARRLIEKIYESHPDFLYVYDLDEPYSFLRNSGLAEAAGWTGEQLASLGNDVWRQLAHPDDLGRIDQHFSRLQGADDGAPVALQWRLRRPDGSWRWFHCRDTVLTRAPQGGARRILGTATDVTDRQRVRQQLEAEKAFVDELLDSLPGIFYLFDEQGRLSRWNNHFEQVSGYTADEIRRMSPLDFVAGEHRSHMSDKLQEALGSGATTAEADLVTREGARLPFLLTGRRISIDGTRCILGVGIDISERKNAECGLRAERQRLQNIIEGTRAGTWELNLQTGEAMCNERWAEIVGYRLEELAPLSAATWEALIHTDDLAWSNYLLDRHLAGELDYYECELRMRHRDGHWVWVLDRGKLTSRAPDGQPLWIAGTHMDITARKRAEERLRLSASVFENTDEGVVITDPDAHIVEVNPAFTEITGYERDEIIGRTPRVLRSGRQDHGFYRSMWRSLTETGHWRGELWNRRKDGAVYPQWLTISSVYSNDGNLSYYVGVFSDISQIKHSQAKLDYLARHDALTDLANRLVLTERLEHAVKHAERRGSLISVVFLDLDHFKHINDSLGHPVGDGLLQGVADALTRAVRTDDTVARIGGDEFVVLIEDLARPEEAAGWAQSLIDVFDEPFRVDTREIRITASAGVSLYPRDGADAATLLSNADAAMHRAKASGRNSYSLYTEELTQQAFERVTLQNALRRALEQDELYLAYQPQVALQSGTIIGAEALARWRHPKLGLISPAKFIPLAEEAGLIHRIEQRVLRMACEQAMAWLKEGLAFGRVAVNIAGQQIQRGQLYDDVRSVLEATGLPPSCLELEVTEGFIMQQVDLAIDQLSELRRLGVTLAIDDFGTGYSSLAHLKRLPVNKLKIDQSFVSDLPQDASDAAITAAVVALGCSLGMTVIAEGVETQAQADFLRARQCNEAQGFLYGRPSTADELAQLVTTAEVS